MLSARTCENNKEKVFGSHFVELWRVRSGLFLSSYLGIKHLDAKIVVVVHLNVWKNLGVSNKFSCE